MACAARPCMRRILAVFVLLAGLSVPAEAVTLRDLIDLSRQGISDDILIALVEAEKSVFHLSAADVRSLKQQGLSDRLVIHLLQTPALRPPPEPVLHLASQRPAAAAEAPARETVIVVDRLETVAVPIYVPVPVASERRVRDKERDSERDRDHARDEKRAPPVYWGYGGKLRAGSWKDR